MAPTTGSSSSVPGPAATPLLASLPDNVRLLSDLTDAQLRWVYAHSRLLVAPSIEDYGLSPLEAAVFGRPSLTLRAGGYLDTVCEGVTGLYVDAPDPAAVPGRAGGARRHTTGTRRCCARTPSGSPRPGFAARLHAEVDDLLRERRRPHATRGGAVTAIGRTARLRSRGHDTPSATPVDPRYWGRATPSASTRGRPTDARHDVAKVP